MRISYGDTKNLVITNLVLFEYIRYKFYNKTKKSNRKLKYFFLDLNWKTKYFNKVAREAQKSSTYPFSLIQTLRNGK